MLQIGRVQCPLCSGSNWRRMIASFLTIETRLDIRRTCEFLAAKSCLTLTNELPAFAANSSDLLLPMRKGHSGNISPRDHFNLINGPINKARLRCTTGFTIWRNKPIERQNRISSVLLRLSDALPPLWRSSSFRGLLTSCCWPKLTPCAVDFQRRWLFIINRVSCFQGKLMQCFFIYFFAIKKHCICWPQKLSA